jgi:hypothetical protein
LQLKFLKLSSFSAQALNQAKRNYIQGTVGPRKSTLALESPAAAQPLFRRAVAIAPQSLDAQYLLGHWLMVKGDWRAAQQPLDKVRQWTLIINWHGRTPD